jgi:hypothetical protein
MSISSGPKVIKDSILVDLDAANFKSTPSTAITNTINPFTINYAVYNNPGFSTTIARTNETFKGAPVYKVTYSPQNSTFISRLSSGEGFGLYHGFGISFLPDTPYMSSIYFKTKYTLENSSTEGFNNTYSNISGWGDSDTSSTRYKESKWTRLYTRFYNNTVVNGISYVGGTAYDTFQAIFNTSVQTDVLITLTIASNGAYTTVTPYGTLASGALGSLSIRKVLISANPYVSDAGGVTSLAIGTASILNHGLDTVSWTKLSTANYRLTENFPLTYYISIRMPSTGGVNRTVTFYPIFTIGQTSTADQKFWKLTFNTSALATGDIIETYWAAPMIEQTNRLYPSPYVINTETKNFFTNTTWPDLSGNNNNITLVNGPLYRGDGGGSFLFDGVDDHGIGSISSSIFTGPHTISAWINRRTMKQWSGVFSNNVNTASCSILTFIDQTSRIGANQAGVDGTHISIDLGNDYLNKWVYVTIVYTGVTSGSPINVYGFKDGSLISSTGNLYWNLNTSSQYYIGRHWTSGTQVHDGFISQVSLYNRALTLDEVRQNFEATRGRYRI